jgi:23S rRNA pseudouridine1911/1915/1917 synthase
VSSHDVVRAIVPERRDGAPLAAVVRDALAVPWSRARDLCRTHRVRVDGNTITDPVTPVRAGAAVEIAPSAPRTTRGVLPREALVYLDAEIAVVRKPAGVVTVPFEDGERDTLVDRLRALLARIERKRHPASRAARDPLVGVVQRLDKDTTGLLVFARSLRAKRALEEQFRAHTVHRRYLAIAHGEVRPARYETYLVPDRGDGLRGSWGRFRRHVGPPPPNAKLAVTHVRPLEPLQGATLVECRLETGRQHQIRIHLSEADHPLVGETVYVRGFVGHRIEAPRPMLHATELGFVHPRTGERMHFDDPPPSDFVACLERLRRRHD